MLAELVDAVIGVDTHRDTHSASLVNNLGAELAATTVAADPDGYQALLRWANEHIPGSRVAWAVEGTRSHGIGLARALRHAGHVVMESDRPKRLTRRPGGKSDPIDARRAAKEALGRDEYAIPRSDGAREAVRILLTTRECAISARTAATNQLKALVMTAPDQLRERLRHLTSGQLLTACLRLRPGRTASVEDSTRQTAMRRLARRIQDLTLEIEAADKDIDFLTRQHVPDLLDQRGIGPITAAQAWISWSEPGRFRHEGAFAALAGVCPIPASSGKNQRHRLNRYGDRALNRALHSIVTTMERCDPDTHAYIAKRTAEGKTRREIRRCLKRYTARKIFRLLERAPTLAATS